MSAFPSSPSFHHTILPHYNRIRGRPMTQRCKDLRSSICLLYLLARRSHMPLPCLGEPERFVLSTFTLIFLGLGVCVLFRGLYLFGHLLVFCYPFPIGFTVHMLSHCLILLASGLVSVPHYLAVLLAVSSAIHRIIFSFSPGSFSLTICHLFLYPSCPHFPLSVSFIVIPNPPLHSCKPIFVYLPHTRSPN